MESIEKLDPNFAVRDAEDGLLWYDIATLGVEGRAFDDTEAPYDRYPATAKGVVRDPVWELQKHSAGMYVRFVTDAPSIGARWKLRFETLAMAHMPATGVSGVDLYMREGPGFRWVAIGVPQSFPDNSATLRASIDGCPHEFLLYLPLYNGVESVSLGVAEGSSIGRAPDWPQGPYKPICFYGTSITQGGCASRPGMSYPSICQRALNRPAYNFGFSGNGQAEPEVAELLARLDPSVYFLDPLPNLTPELVGERIEPFVRVLRDARPETPIVLVENITPTRALSSEVADLQTDWQQKNTILRAAYDRLVTSGVTGVHYMQGDGLFGTDFEGTVDGVHATDVGFMRMADAFTRALRGLI